MGPKKKGGKKKKKGAGGVPTDPDADGRAGNLGQREVLI